MAVAPAVQPQTMRVTILAQDPSVPIFAEVEIPCEVTSEGPRGSRVRVVDYDASSGILYKPAPSKVSSDENMTVDAILKDPAFHAHNVYAIVMRTLARFEFALGRRVSWSFDGHEIFVAPHAFADANAFYSKRDRGLFFGYFTGNNGNRIFTCLSHDVVAHETTHALVDGLRERFTDPSSPDQAAFHEGIADVVALLSIFSIPEAVMRALDLHNQQDANRTPGRLVEKRHLTAAYLKNSVLLGLGEEVGQGLASGKKRTGDKRIEALRRSVQLPHNPNILSSEKYLEPHNRGEVLVAAIMNAFVNIWCARIAQLGSIHEKMVDRGRVAEDGATAAEHLLTMVIRALDYAPPVDLRFGDYLSALLTADYEIQPDDGKYHYRQKLCDSFASYGINPSSPAPGGTWARPDQSTAQDSKQFRAPSYLWTHFESMQRDRDEVFRFMWQNRDVLEIEEDPYTRVLSVQPCTRISADGFILHETVAEYLQMITVKAAELPDLKWYIPDYLPPDQQAKLKPFPIPQGMPNDKKITVFGGGTLIFDEYGQLKYHVRNKIFNASRQAERLQYLWDSGYFDQSEDTTRRFAAIHRLRWTDDPGFAVDRSSSHDEYF